PGAATEGVRADWIDGRLAVFGGSTASATGVGELSDQLRLWQPAEES
ncbi:MAG: hypothetical protein JWM64_429, partial [Frankiales bacterium]|nr:hypothetical protein [Frankiales bacterium]